MHKNERLKGVQFSRRAFVLGGLQTSAFAALAARLYYLQGVKVAEYTTKAEGNRIRLIPSMPERGKILDRHGKILAEGAGEYQLTFEKEKALDEKEMSSSTATIANILKLEEADKNQVFDLMLKTKVGQTSILYRGVPWEALITLEMNIKDLAGVEIEHAVIRGYPTGALTAHLIGYVGKLDQKTIDAKPELKVFAHDPNFRIGKMGIEKSFEDQLHGVIGARRLEVDSRGRHVRELERTPSQNGSDVPLTIDLSLQKYVTELLMEGNGRSSEAGSAVVMDVRNGDVLAMVSLPSYDNNLFVEGINQDYWNELLHNPNRPLSNKAISSKYPPGSTFKPITAMAALEAGVIDEDHRVFCPGYYEFGGRQFHCWNKKGHGSVSVREAIGVSCNVFFFDTASRMNIDKIATMGNLFGLGQQTGILLSGESAGVMANKEWKKKALKESWYRGETLNSAIGQGYNLVTPLQLAVQVSRLATHTNVSPRISTLEPVVPFEKITEVSDATLDLVRKGMYLVVNNKMGSAYPYRIQEGDWQFVGKTGTAQTISKTSEKLAAKLEERTHALFIGYAPFDEPRYAVSVVVENGGFGSAVSAPIAAKIFRRLRQMEGQK